MRGIPEDVLEVGAPDSGERPAEHVVRDRVKTLVACQFQLDAIARASSAGVAITVSRHERHNPHSTRTSTDSSCRPAAIMLVELKIVALITVIFVPHTAEARYTLPARPSMCFFAAAALCTGWERLGRASESRS